MVWANIRKMILNLMYVFSQFWNTQGISSMSLEYLIIHCLIFRSDDVIYTYMLQIHRNLNTNSCNDQKMLNEYNFASLKRCYMSIIAFTSFRLQRDLSSSPTMRRENLGFLSNFCQRN